MRNTKARHTVREFDSIEGGTRDDGLQGAGAGGTKAGGTKEGDKKGASGASARGSAAWATARAVRRRVFPAALLHAVVCVVFFAIVLAAECGRKALFLGRNVTPFECVGVEVPLSEAHVHRKAAPVTRRPRAPHELRWEHAPGAHNGGPDADDECAPDRAVARACDPGAEDVPSRGSVP